MRRPFLLFLFCASLALTIPAERLPAQHTDPRSPFEENILRYGGSSAPYEVSDIVQHPAPKGYKPFYISHFGRHGSRYHTTASLCPGLVRTFHAADSLHLLKEPGKQIYAILVRMDSVSRGKTGDLTAVGADEHRGIASRMAAAYPSLFRGKSGKISAQATTSPRVILSMAYFCEVLKLRNPRLEIMMESGDATSAYLNHYTPEYREYYANGPWRNVRDSWLQAHLDAAPVIDTLFFSADLFGGKANGKEARRFVQDLYSLAKISAASGFPPFFDKFPEEALYVLWQSGNMDQYLRKGPSPLSEGKNLAIAKPLLKDFIEKADRVVREGGNVADLRFGHGEGIMPLAGLMGIEEASGVCDDPDKIAATWQDFRITTMAANIQWVFYRNREGRVLLKILLNERESRIPVPTDRWPYYDWESVRDHYQSILK